MSQTTSESSPASTALSAEQKLERLFKVGKSARKAKQRFLLALSWSGKITEAAKQAGVSPALHFYWKDRDPKYLEALEQVKIVQNAMLQDEIWDRAINGAERPVTYKGEITCYYKEKSDELLKFEAKARMPEYRDGTNINLLTQGPQSITFVSGRERPELVCTQPQGTNSVKSIPPPTSENKATSK